MLLALAKHLANTASESLISAPPVLVNLGELISFQKTPWVVVGGLLQFTEHRLWLFTPFTAKKPGSVCEFPSTSPYSAPAAPFA